MAAVSRRRVVVTGLGLCTPLGIGASIVWQRLLDGLSGIVALPDSSGDYRDIPSKVVGLVPTGSGDGDFSEGSVVSLSERRAMTLGSVYALSSAQQALSDANWFPQTDSDKMATGVSIGSCMPDLDEIVTVGKYVSEGKHRRISPYFVTKTLCNLPAGHVSMKYGLLGPNHSVSTACTTGLHCIGDAAAMIARGTCDVMIAGGTEACIHPISLAGFCRMKALSTKFNSQPAKASRPFDSQRDGFVMSEGCGLLVLEDLHHALNRNATIYAEILGYGLSSDAFHVSIPVETGHGIINCMTFAMKDADITPQSVGHINVHATSTPAGDLAENNAIKILFREHSQDLLISACKGSLGHLLAASGSVEAILTVLAVHHGVTPPTLNVENLEPEYDMNYCADGPVKWDNGGRRRVALTNSFGFGGTNASICIAEYNDS